MPMSDTGGGFRRMQPFRISSDCFVCARSCLIRGPLEEAEREGKADRKAQDAEQRPPVDLCGATGGGVSPAGPLFLTLLVA